MPAVPSRPAIISASKSVPQVIRVTKFIFMSSGVSSLNFQLGAMRSGGVFAAISDADVLNSSVPHPLQWTASSAFSRPQYAQAFIGCFCSPHQIPLRQTCIFFYRPNSIVEFSATLRVDSGGARLCRRGQSQQRENAAVWKSFNAIEHFNPLRLVLRAHSAPQENSTHLLTPSNTPLPDLYILLPAPVSIPHPASVRRP